LGTSALQSVERLSSAVQFWNLAERREAIGDNRSTLCKTAVPSRSVLESCRAAGSDWDNRSTKCRTAVPSRLILESHRGAGSDWDNRSTLCKTAVPSRLILESHRRARSDWGQSLDTVSNGCPQPFFPRHFGHERFTLCRRCGWNASAIRLASAGQRPDEDSGRSSVGSTTTCLIRWRFQV
jgi:hypothetical protein